jgi:hypothetical protein
MRAMLRLGPGVGAGAASRPRAAQRARPRGQRRLQDRADAPALRTGAGRAGAPRGPEGRRGESSTAKQVGGRPFAAGARTEGRSSAARGSCGEATQQPGGDRHAAGEGGATDLGNRGRGLRGGPADAAFGGWGATGRPHQPAMHSPRLHRGRDGEVSAWKTDRSTLGRSNGRCRRRLSAWFAGRGCRSCPSFIMPQ